MHEVQKVKKNVRALHVFSRVARVPTAFLHH